MSDNITELRFTHNAPMDSRGFRCLQMFQQWQRRIDIILSPYSLTQQSFSILAMCGWLSEKNYRATKCIAVRQKVLVEMSGIPKMQVSLNLRRLEHNNLITVQPFLPDRRERIIALTDLGICTLNDTLILVEEEDQRLLNDVHFGE
ncbi:MULTISPECIES: MarR family winged helix-turn-helix transcriptional regulator [Yersinia]|uniref:MarR family winged helix-turn-helix transcriptional regulator n=2 Tax=Yersiniaceae TaxID=1903411 RepID=UPI0005DCC3CA|nr:MULTISPECIES: MarR family transcriptional regulator [Yersinia]MDN0102016.1 MarR family transcriptional regulator [Yersinia bercovieri]QDW31686.1 MarR family transcriptional regulator [Yersinia sp. KBS0713]QDW33434.1 MarR family transcriptional regulator [Yersinia sp. KBS0713]CNI17229.1 Uncharacterised protein [Yersinia bercovieri]